MKLDKITVAGVVVALITVGLFLIIIAHSPFSTFNPSFASNRLINTTGNIGPQDSSFMWTNRTLDLMVQAFVVFAAAAGCLAVLRIDEKKEDVND